MTEKALTDSVSVGTVEQDGITLTQRTGPPVLANYRLLQRLGQGGMGYVYKAEDVVIQRPVALKILHKRFANMPEFIARFHQEARAAGKLSHPNIVSAISTGEANGHFYYVMEFCDGESLDRWLEREKVMPCEKALDIAEQVALGLHHAHEQGIVHRDIKPANIMIRQDGTAKILDFGLARDVVSQKETEGKEGGVAWGTPSCISPEQARGSKDISGSSDLYSLGATLYYLVTGQQAYQGTAKEVVRQHLKAAAPDPRSVKADLPDAVSFLVTRMLGKKPEDRYADCAELALAIRLAKRGQIPTPQAVQTAKETAELEPQPASTDTQDATVAKARTTSRRLIPVCLAAVIAVVLLVGIVASSSRPAPTEKATKTANVNHLLEKERQKAQVSVIEAEAAKQRAEEARLEAEQRAREMERMAEEARLAKAEAEKSELKVLKQQAERERQLAEQAEEERRQIELRRRLMELKHRKERAEASSKTSVSPRPWENTRLVKPEEREPDPNTLPEIDEWANKVLDESYPRQPSAARDIERVRDVDGLKKTYTVLTYRISDAERTAQKARASETAARNQIEFAERRLESMQEAFNRAFPSRRRSKYSSTKRDYSTRTTSMIERTRQIQNLMREREKAQSLISAKGSAMSKASAEAERMERVASVLKDVKQSVKVRLETLGVDDANPVQIAATPKEADPSPYKLYVLKDGRELKAYMAMKMGNEIVIKDKDGEMQRVKASDVKEIRNGP